MKRRYIAGLIVVVLMLNALGTAEASFIQMKLGTESLPGLDYYSDFFLTRDTLTNLTWLDIPLTKNHSYDEVKLSSYMTQGEVFRYATEQEVSTLNQHIIDQNAINIDPADNMLLYFGSSWVDNLGWGQIRYTAGIIGDDQSRKIITISQTCGSTDGWRCYPLTFGVSDDDITADYRDTVTGSWLVRGSSNPPPSGTPVPEPSSTMLLLGAVLGGLALWRGTARR
jgi:hypothetical protein